MKMYRSKLTIDLLDPSVQRAMRDVNDMHRNLMRAFGQIDSDTPRAAESFIYSLVNYNDRPAVYVLSVSKPDWSRVRGYEPVDEPRDITPLKNKLKAGGLFGFRLFASPTKKTSREGRLSARVFLRSGEERRAWFERRAKAAGFSVLSLSENGETRVHGSKNGCPIDYTGVVFSGVLRIEDEESFWKAYCGGIGPGKAYGLGMLMIRRI